MIFLWRPILLCLIVLVRLTVALLGQTDCNILNEKYILGAALVGGLGAKSPGVPGAEALVGVSRHRKIFNNVNKKRCKFMLEIRSYERNYVINIRV